MRKGLNTTSEVCNMASSPSGEGSAPTFGFVINTRNRRACHRQSEVEHAMAFNDHLAFA